MFKIATSPHNHYHYWYWIRYLFQYCLLLGYCITEMSTKIQRRVLVCRSPKKSEHLGEHFNVMWYYYFVFDADIIIISIFYNIVLYIVRCLLTIVMSHYTAISKVDIVGFLSLCNVCQINYDWLTTIQNFRLLVWQIFGTWYDLV